MRKIGKTKKKDHPSKWSWFTKVFLFSCLLCYATLTQMKMDTAFLFEVAPSFDHLAFASPTLNNATSEKTLHATTSRSDPNATFSACILWMDDNHRLEEWLAFHHFVMNLRYVVMTIDVNSRTSPQSIIDRWNQHETANMTIVVLNETEYVTNYDKLQKSIHDETAEDKKSQKKINYHRHRQKEFYRACSEHLVEQKRGWTSYHDIDEYVSFDWWVGSQNITHIGQSKLQQPGYVVHKLNAIRDKILTDYGRDLSCLYLSRMRYCSREMSLPEIRDVSRYVVPDGLGIKPTKVVQKLDTLRYKYITPGDDGNPKSLIDLSQPDAIRFVKQTLYNDTNKGSYNWGVHFPMKTLCSLEGRNRLKEVQKILDDEHLVINHYLGSWEAYSFRDDARVGVLRHYSAWEERANMTIGEYSHVVRPWLNGFARSVGVDTAAYLLQDAGRFPEGYHAMDKLESYRFQRNTDFSTKRKPTKINGRRGVNFLQVFPNATLD